MGNLDQLLGHPKGRLVLARGIRGVSLIEMIVGLAILSILLMMGVPAFSTFLQNGKLRSAAESVQAGLQLARTEAVTRNGRVELVLTDDEPVATMVNSLTASASGMSWMVRYYDPTTLFYTFIEGKAAAEGSGQADTTSVVVSATDATISFNGLGSTTLAATSTFQFTNPAGGTCAAVGGPMRCLNVTVTPGGQIKMCDPAVSAAGDTRKC